MSTAPAETVSTPTAITAPSAEPTAPVETATPPAEGETAPAAETPASPPAPAAAAEPPAKSRAEQFAERARASRELREREQSIERVKADAELAAKARELAKSDPIEALRILGTDVEALSRAVTPADPAAETQAKIAALEKQLAEFTAQREQQDLQSRIARGREIVATTIAAKADDFPLVAELKLADEVFDTMAACRREHGLTLTIDEAAAEVEAFYAEQEAGYERAKLRRAKKTAGSPTAPQTPERALPTAHPPATISSRLATEAPIARPGRFDLDAHKAQVLQEFTGE